jgi:hypothetical protein
VAINKKRLYRLYWEEGLSVRRRRGRKRVTGTRATLALAQGPNQRWSLDFVSDALSCGRRIRIMCIVDDFTREGLALVVGTSIGGRRLVRELEALGRVDKPAERGFPAGRGRDSTLISCMEISVDPRAAAGQGVVFLRAFRGVGQPAWRQARPRPPARAGRHLLDRSHGRAMA